MKKFLSLLVLLPLLLPAQTVKKGESALVYSLPATELILHVKIEKVKEQPGRFYRYADRFLATNSVITSEQTSYRVKDIEVDTRTVPDSERIYTVIASKKSLASNLTVTNEGLLCGINVEPLLIPTAGSAPKRATVIKKEQDILPLSEEYMLAGSEMKMAEGAAKEIYRLRENRMDILAGDVEFVPTDGNSMKAILDEIDAGEKALVELFTGSVHTEEFIHTIRYIPRKATRDEVLFRFSSYIGMLDKDELSGEPYYINIEYTAVKELAPDKPQKKKNSEEIFSLIPVTAHVELANSKNSFFQGDILLPQLGVQTPLPLGSMNRYSKAYVSPESGRLLSVEQHKK